MVSCSLFCLGSSLEPKDIDNTYRKLQALLLSNFVDSYTIRISHTKGLLNLFQIRM